MPRAHNTLLAQYTFVISSALKCQLLSEVQVPHQAERRQLACLKYGCARGTLSSCRTSFAGTRIKMLVLNHRTAGYVQRGVGSRCDH